MEPTYVCPDCDTGFSDVPGTCPDCGAELVLIEDTGAIKNEAYSEADLDDEDDEFSEDEPVTLKHKSAEDY